eukprot:TRINITY_DN3534_c0_g1_i1.p1 TRINITY_DN3534_c0_g1~~TRINITY_DN3534_c0_g1_i1.p1  ORF type:complete len:241 (+),score=26.43 TRINITY_DN3534_c0_g1_i1:100-822(+)
MSKVEDQLDSFVREITQLRENLYIDVQDQKDFPQEMAALTKAATGYRFALMNLHESGKSLANEFKSFGEKYARESVFATEFASRALDQTDIETSRVELHTKLWDDFILPNMTASDPDTKDFQKVEKKLCGLAQDFENQAKSELREYKKQIKSKKNKGRLEEIKQLHTQELQSIRGKLDLVVRYWEIWKERRYDFWLRFLCGAFDAQREHSLRCDDILYPATWSKVVENEPASLPDLREES